MYEGYKSKDSLNMYMFQSICQHIRYIWLIFNIFFHMLVFGPLFYILILCARPFVQKETIHKYIGYLGSVYFKICIWAADLKIHVYGIENIDPNQHYIYMPNHTSNFDVPILYSILPYWIIYVYKHSLADIPIFGWFLSASANVPINRFNTAESVQNMNNLASELYTKKTSVLIFPEGKIATTEEMNQFKMGGSILAIKTGIDIVPISISGCKQIINNHAINTEPIKIVIGKPIKTTGLDVETDKQSLTQNIFNLVKASKDTEQPSEPYIISMSFLQCFLPNV